MTSVRFAISFLWLEVGAAASAGYFDADGRDELLSRHDGNGAWVYNDIENGVGRRQELALDVPDADRFASVADLDGDGRDDILMRGLADSPRHPEPIVPCCLRRCIAAST